MEWCKFQANSQASQGHLDKLIPFFRLTARKPFGRLITATMNDE